MNDYSWGKDYIQLEIPPGFVWNEDHTEQRHPLAVYKSSSAEFGHHTVKMGNPIKKNHEELVAHLTTMFCPPRLRLSTAHIHRKFEWSIIYSANAVVEFRFNEHMTVNNRSPGDVYEVDDNDLGALKYNYYVNYRVTTDMLISLKLRFPEKFSD